MELVEYDKKVISKMSEKQVKHELLTALKVIRKVSDNVPAHMRRPTASYSIKGHIICVNYLRGFLNIWEKQDGT